MFSASYYDGRSARRHPVDVSIGQGMLSISGAGIHRVEPLERVHISERLGSAPRLLRLADGAFCEVRDLAALQAELGESGRRPDLIERLHHSWRTAVIAAAVCVAAAGAAYRWGLPLGAEVLAAHVPPEVSQQLSQSTLNSLDGVLLYSSSLPQARRQALAEEFAALRAPDDKAATAHIEFRSSPQIGPNAFALPDGRVVLLDQLVSLARNDEEIEGVLAHELGHVHYRHGLRMLLQGSAVALAMTAWFGDFSTLLATVPTVLLQTRYSRGFETQADDYATRMLLANDIPPSRLADLLERLSREHRDKRGQGSAAQDKGKAADKSGKPGAEEEQSDYISSHPATAERLKRLRAADAQLQARPKIGG